MPAQRILLVEDDAILRDVVRRNLLARGHEVRLAADAQSALTHLQAAPVNLVVLDINLPDQTGWDVLRIAQQCGWLCPRVHKEDTGHEGDAARLPVVVLSAVRVSLTRLQECGPAGLPTQTVSHGCPSAPGRRDSSGDFFSGAGGQIEKP